MFEPARSQIVLQDRVTHMITLSTFRRLRLNAGSYEGLFLCIPGLHVVAQFAVPHSYPIVPAGDGCPVDQSATRQVLCPN